MEKADRARGTSTRNPKWDDWELPEGVASNRWDWLQYGRCTEGGGETSVDLHNLYYHEELDFSLMRKDCFQIF